VRVIVLLLLWCATAEAASAWIVRIEGGDVFVAAGRRDGLRVGTSVPAQKRVRAKNPANGRPVEGLFELGPLEVADVSEGLSRLTGSRDLIDRLEVGDAVALPVPEPATEEHAAASSLPPELSEKSPATPPQPAACAPAASDELPMLRETWARAQDVPPAGRLEIWQRFLTDHPNSVLTAVIQREIGFLSELVQTQKAKQPPPANASMVTINFPATGDEGHPLPIAALPEANRPVEAVLVHYRKPGEPTFKTLHLEQSGDTFVGQIPAQELHAGELQLFAEAVLPEGPVLSYGSAQAPNFVEIDASRTASADLRNRSRIRVSYEFVDFNHFRGNDTYQVLEGDFLYRVYAGLYSVRTGFGTMDGKAAPKAFLDDRTGAYVRNVGFHYGYAEFEFRLGESVSTISRLIAGVQEDGLHVGAEGKLRIGKETGTSLLIGAGTTSQIGSRVMLELATNAVPNWPMSGQVVVTTEPIADAAGVRFIYTAGRKLTSWLDLSARVGYQLRDIQHSGVSGGLTTTFHW
jgi:hypothetical protein